MQDEEVSNFSPINESSPLENGDNWSEESSSTLTVADTAIKQLSSVSKFADFKRSGITELEYVTDILSNAELMTEEFVLGQTNQVIMPNLFELLENHSSATENYPEEESKLERKVWFDCVTECLESRYKQAFVGRCKAWPRVDLDHRKGWLAEELYNEILAFKSMEEEMVDELVCKDMSTGYGRWLNFDLEAFELVLEFEREISTSLINELFSDLLLV